MHTTTLLSDAEERALAGKINNGDQQALQQLIEANQGFVVKLAHQYETNNVTLADLVSEGNIALIQAARRYAQQPTKRFAPFAAPYIRHAMQEAVGIYTQPLQPNNTKATQASPRAPKTWSVDQPLPIGSHTTFNLLHIIENPDAVQADNVAQQQTIVEWLTPRLTRLNEREQQVICHLYGLHSPSLTMAETATKMNLKRERVRQIRDAALRKLRK